MNAIKCELCGSNQLFKKDGFFQCEFCGTKYSLEEARKLIGTVEIEGDVSVKDADYIIRAGVLEKYNGSDENAIIPTNVSIIGKEAFNGCLGLKSVNIPSSVKRIENGESSHGIKVGAFSYCCNLREISLPSGFIEIGDYAFCGCNNLTQVHIPNSTKRIGVSAFEKCVSLNGIDIPNSVTIIDSNAFEECSSLSLFSEKIQIDQ